MHVKRKTIFPFSEMPNSELSAREQAHMLAPILKSLVDENRLTIILTLAKSACSNKELQEATGLSKRWSFTTSPH